MHSKTYSALELGGVTKMETVFEISYGKDRGIGVVGL